MHLATVEELAAVALSHLRADERFTAPASRQQFVAAQPFPHVAFDRVLPEWLLEQLDVEFPENIPPHDCKRLGRRIGWHCTMQPNRVGGYLKLGVGLEAAMGNASRALMSVFKHESFVRQLEALTGIGPMHADQKNIGSGLHQILPNGSLQVHADNNHPRSGFERRVNLFLYLNSGWLAEWGGDLELWPRSLHACDARIAPLRNRLVVFASTDYSYHGHPKPLSCPIGRSRRSLAVYYYTSGSSRPPNEVDRTERKRGATTIYKQPSEQCAPRSS